MSRIQCRRASLELQACWKCLPDDVRGSLHALQFAMIEKMPQAPRYLPVAEKMKKKIREACMLDTPVITPTQLTELISYELLKTPQQAFFVQPRGRVPSTTMCANCGEFGHMHDTCTVRCSECDLGYCPGARGGNCAVTTHRPPDASKLKNALDKQMPRSLVKKFNRLRRARNLNQIILPKEVARAADGYSEGSSTSEDSDTGEREAGDVSFSAATESDTYSPPDEEAPDDNEHGGIFFSFAVTSNADAPCDPDDEMPTYSFDLPPQEIALPTLTDSGPTQICLDKLRNLGERILKLATSQLSAHDSLQPNIKPAAKYKPVEIVPLDT